MHVRGEEPERRGPNFRPHSLGGHQDDVHDAVTVLWRRRRVAVGDPLDSKPGGEWPTDDQDPRDDSKSSLRASPTPADGAP